MSSHVEIFYENQAWINCAPKADHTRAGTPNPFRSRTFCLVKKEKKTSSLKNSVEWVKQGKRELQILSWTPSYLYYFDNDYISVTSRLIYLLMDCEIFNSCLN